MVVGREGTLSRGSRESCAALRCRLSALRPALGSAPPVKEETLEGVEAVPAVAVPWAGPRLPMGAATLGHESSTPPGLPTASPARAPPAALP